MCHPEGGPTTATRLSRSGSGMLSRAPRGDATRLALTARPPKVPRKAAGSTPRRGSDPRKRRYSPEPPGVAVQPCNRHAAVTGESVRTSKPAGDSWWGTVIPPHSVSRSLTLSLCAYSHGEASQRFRGKSNRTSQESREDSPRSGHCHRHRSRGIPSPLPHATHSHCGEHG